MNYKIKLNASIIAVAVCGVFCGAFSQTSEPYQWPAYVPNIGHDLAANNPFKDIEPPTRNHIPSGYNVVDTFNGKWWAFYAGPLRKSDVTDQAIRNMLTRFDHDFEYMNKVMGWPPDSRVRRGYRSVIYYHGSGIHSRFGASDTNATGGWQSSDGFSPIVLLSYVPIAAFHATPGLNHIPANSQRDAAIHEGVHAVFADLVNPAGETTGPLLPGWFHEAGNTWAQKMMVARQQNTFGSWNQLDFTHFMAPFMPIECYSGWLQDGSFGGPNAEGVNMYIDASGNIHTSSGSGRTQLVTWRRFLGGTQYGNGFTSFMGEWLGEGSVAWVTMNIANRNDRILGTMARGLGEAQLRRFITEFRAKQATADIRRWTQSLRSGKNTYMGTNVNPEGNSTTNWCARDPNATGSCADLAWSATPYVVTTNDGNGVLTPDPRTLPAWSGANQIPLRVPANMNTIEIDFMPDTANMSLTIAYRDVNGYAVYSHPVYPAAGATGTARLTFPAGARPANDVVIAVISNSDYIYRGDVSRRAKYKYKIRIKDGVTIAPITGNNARYWNLNNLKEMPGHTDGTTAMRDASRNRASISSAARVTVRDRVLNVSSPDNSALTIRMIDVRGKVRARFNANGNAKFALTKIPAGRYFVEVKGAGGIGQRSAVIVR